MKEAQMQTLFSHWVREHMPSTEYSIAWELKLIKTQSFPFAKVPEHQINGLLSVKEEGLYHKISDSPIFKGQRTRFTAKKPMDCFLIKGQAYLVVLFYKPRKPKIMYWIDIDTFLQAKEDISRKSLTEKMVKDMAQYEFELKNKW